MGYVDDAFEKMREAAEITTGEQQLASRRHNRIRAVVEDLWDIETTFLTGSYKRHTKIKPLADVDIFVVVKRDGAQGHYRDGPPGAILDDLCADLDDKFMHVRVDGMAVVIEMSDDDGQASFELVPAYEHSSSGYEIPDPGRGAWIRTDPSVHKDLTSTKNSECADKWVPFVKMLKSWNRVAADPISPSFLLEVMALGLVKSPFGRYQDEMATIFGNIIDGADGPWPDPAGLGPDVDDQMTAHDRATVRDAATGALAIAEEAIYLQDEGHERAAVEKWRELFGERMPRP